jgi:hypothetical protein
VQKVIELITSFPTVVFTVPLIFCFMWFLLGIVVSGFDVGEGDFDVDIDGDGDIDVFESFAAAMHLGALGLPLVLLLLSLAGWVTSLLFSGLMDSLGASSTVTVVGGLVLGLAAGVLFVRTVGGAVGRGLATEQAPERSAAIGCTCKVRTLEVNERFGDAELLSGPMRTSLIKVRAKAGAFHRGDVALVVEHDPASDAYFIAEIEEEYQPHR